MLSPDTIKTLAELESEHITHTLKALDGNISRTARALGIDRRTLYRKARAIGLMGKGARGRISHAELELRAELEATRAELARLKGEGSTP